MEEAGSTPPRTVESPRPDPSLVPAGQAEHASDEVASALARIQDARRAFGEAHDRAEALISQADEACGEVEDQLRALLDERQQMLFAFAGRVLVTPRPLRCVALLEGARCSDLVFPADVVGADADEFVIGLWALGDRRVRAQLCPVHDREGAAASAAVEWVDVPTPEPWEEY